MEAQINNISIEELSNDKTNTSQSPDNSRRVSFINKKDRSQKGGKTEKLNRSMNINFQNLVENISPSSSFVINSSRSGRGESTFINNQISQISKLSAKEKKDNGKKKSYKIIKHINESKNGKEEKDNIDLVIKPKEDCDFNMNIYKTYSEEEFYSKLKEVNEVNVEISESKKTNLELEIGNYQFDDLEKINNLIVNRMNLIKKASLQNEIIKSSQFTFNFESKIESKMKTTKKTIVNIPIIKEIEYIFPIKNENILENITNFTINSAYQRVGRRYFQEEMDNFRIMSSYVYIIDKSLLSFHPPTINHDSEIVHKSNTCKYSKYKSKDFMLNNENVYNNDIYKSFNKLELNSNSNSKSKSNKDSNYIERVVLPTNKEKNYQLIDDKYNSFNTINQSSNLKISTNLKEELKYLLEKNNQSETIKNDRSLFHIFKEFYIKKENLYMIDSIYNNKAGVFEEPLTSRNRRKKMKGNIINI